MWLKLILCFLIEVTGISAEITFTIREVNNSVACLETSESPLYATVLENEKLTLNVTLENFNSNYINYFQCFSRNDAEVVHNPDVLPRNLATSDKITTQMAGIWKCRIRFNRGTSLIQPIEEVREKIRYNFYTVNYTVAHCHVQIHVRRSETPQNILVSNMIVPTTQITNTDGEVDHSAEYWFLEGDSVDVACIPGPSIIGNENSNSGYRIQFRYDYAENMDDMFKETNIPSDLGYGFRTKLRAVHNNSKLTCKCIGPNDYTTIEVTFVLPTRLESYGYLQMNDLISRPFRNDVNNFNVKNYQPNYIFLDHTNINWVCNTNERDYTTTNVANNCKENTQETSPFKKAMVTPFEFTCVVCHFNQLIEKYTGKIINMAATFREKENLILDLPKDNILLEMYKLDPYTRNSWFYYEFEENDNVTLKCTQTQIQDYRIYEVKYKFNKEEIGESNRTLTDEDDKKMFECILREKPPSRETKEIIFKNITVLFRKKVEILTTTTFPTTSTDQSLTSQDVQSGQSKPLETTQSNGDHLLPIIVAGGILVCIVLVCVVIAIYRMWTRNKKREPNENNYENLQNHSSQVSIPPYPEQWSRNDDQNYHNPVDLRNDSTIYAEPVRGQEDPYAIPIPKNQRSRKAGQDIPEPTYSELDLPPSTGRLPYSNLREPQYAVARELYAQVTPRNQRENKDDSYKNVFPNSQYENSERVEYVEPTYCQPHKL